MTPEEISEQLRILQDYSAASARLCIRMNTLTVQVNVARVLIYVGLAGTTTFFLTGRQVGAFAWLAATASTLAVLMMAHAHLAARSILKRMKAIAQEATARAEATKRRLES